MQNREMPNETEINETEIRECLKGFYAGQTASKLAFKRQASIKADQIKFIFFAKPRIYVLAYCHGYNSQNARVLSQIVMHSQALQGFIPKNLSVDEYSPTADETTKVIEYLNGYKAGKNPHTKRSEPHPATMRHHTAFYSAAYTLGNQVKRQKKLNISKKRSHDEPTTTMTPEKSEEPPTKKQRLIITLPHTAVSLNKEKPAHDILWQWEQVETSGKSGSIQPFIQPSMDPRLFSRSPFELDSREEKKMDSHMQVQKNA